MNNEIMKRIVRTEAELNTLLASMRTAGTCEDIERLTVLCDVKCAEIQLLTHQMLEMENERKN